MASRRSWPGAARPWPSTSSSWCCVGDEQVGWVSLYGRLVSEASPSRLQFHSPFSILLTRLSAVGREEHGGLRAGVAVVGEPFRRNVFSTAI